MRLADPALLALLAAWLVLGAWLVRRGLLRDRRAAEFADSVMIRRLTRGRDRRRTWMRLALVLVGGALAAFALAGPRWGMRQEKVETRGADVVFAVDLSRSMNARDLAPSRLEAARRELDDLVGRLEGNRLGLVGFAGAAFTFAPLTLDAGAARLFLDQMVPEAVPIPGTAIGDAVRTALTLYPEGDGPKILVLLTDGEDHHSEPLKAAEEAARQGVRIVALGLGRPEGELVPRLDDEGREMGPLRDDSGEPVHSRLDEATLREMARITGGTYVRVTPGSGASRAVLDAVAREETRELQSRMEQRLQERFQLFLALGLGLVLAGRLLDDAGSGEVAS